MGAVAGALDLGAGEDAGVTIRLRHFQQEAEGAGHEALEHVAERRLGSALRAPRCTECEHRVPEGDLAVPSGNFQPIDRELAPAALREPLEVKPERRLGGEAMGLRFGIAPVNRLLLRGRL